MKYEDYKAIDNFFENEVENVQKREQTETKKKKKKGIKEIILSVTAIILAGIATLVILLPGKKSDKKNTSSKTSSVITVADLGVEEEIVSKPNKQYGETTGNIKKEDLVEKNGVIYKDKEAADKSNKVGTSSIDLQGGKLEIDKNGDVVEKDKGYKIIDESGKVISSGSNSTGIPKGYAWDSVLNKYVKEDQVGKYVYVDATYYAQDGEIVYKKGDIVLKETLEKIKKQLSTTKPVVSSNNSSKTQGNISSNTSSETQSNASSNTSSNVSTSTSSNVSSNTSSTESSTIEQTGKVNPDGTYTIYGVTYMDKATFENFVLDENALVNFGYYKGVIYPREVIEDMIQQKQNVK